MRCSELRKKKKKVRRRRRLQANCSSSRSIRFSRWSSSLGEIERNEKKWGGEDVDGTSGSWNLPTTTTLAPSLESATSISNDLLRALIDQSILTLKTNRTKIRFRWCVEKENIVWSSASIRSDQRLISMYIDKRSSSLTCLSFESALLVFALSNNTTTCQSIKSSTQLVPSVCAGLLSSVVYWPRSSSCINPCRRRTDSSSKRKDADGDVVLRAASLLVLWMNTSKHKRKAA